MNNPPGLPPVTWPRPYRSRGARPPGIWARPQPSTAWWGSCWRTPTTWRLTVSGSIPHTRPGCGRRWTSMMPCREFLQSNPTISNALANALHIDVAEPVDSSNATPWARRALLSRHRGDRLRELGKDVGWRNLHGHEDVPAEVPGGDHRNSPPPADIHPWSPVAGHGCGVSQQREC
jgi:hypothetical protein